MGDSLSQGFKNGCIHRTDLSFPAILARSLGKVPFEQPSFSAQGGIPINLEVLIRSLSEKYGDDITIRNSFGAATDVFKTLKRVKAYWEGRTRSLKTEQHTPYHNQSIWGFAISEVLNMNEKLSREYIRENKIRYSVFNILPDHAMYTTARLVLNPTFGPKHALHSMTDNIRELHEDGGIENLICCIGHNNIVSSVTGMKLTYSEKSDILAPYAERKCTVYRPDHFKTEMRTLYETLSKLDIRRVFVPTIPYVTIPPAIRGVNPDGTDPVGGYYDYYSHFWIWDDEFDPGRHEHITRLQAIELDQVVDQYNQIIRDLAREFDFHVVPIARHVSAVARRRRGANSVAPLPKEFIHALKKNESTRYLAEETNRIRISTDYIRMNEQNGRIDRGGIFSLDGLHPTTIGYGLMANIYRMRMEEAGVEFEKPIDWDWIIENEPLITDPPPLLNNLRNMLRFLTLDNHERLAFIGKNFLELLLETLSPGPEVDQTG